MEIKSHVNALEKIKEESIAADCMGTVMTQSWTNGSASETFGKLNIQVTNQLVNRGNK